MKSSTIFCNLALFETFFILTVVTVGLIGNTICLAIFRFSKLKYTTFLFVNICYIERILLNQFFLILRENNSSLILRALAFTDNGFLVTILVTNLHRFNINIYKENDIVCKATIYASYVFSFLSVWYIVAFSLERFSVVYFPFGKGFTKSIKKNGIFVLFIVSLVYYSFWFKMTGIVGEQEKVCTTYPEWFDIGLTMTLIDTCITIMIPFFLIATCNILISIKLMKNSLTSKRKSTSSRDNSDFMSSLNSKSNKLIIMMRKIKRDKNVSFENTTYQSKSNQKVMFLHTDSFSNISRIKNYSKTTRMLLIISSVFIFLNTPLTMSKVKNFLNYFQQSNAIMNDESYVFIELLSLIETNITETISNENISLSVTIEHSDTTKDELIDRISIYLYYVNFSINFFLYAFNGPKFKSTFLSLFKSESKV
jgi:hypothetical protein